MLNEVDELGPFQQANQFWEPFRMDAYVYDFHLAQNLVLIIRIVENLVHNGKQMGKQTLHTVSR